MATKTETKVISNPDPKAKAQAPATTSGNPVPAPAAGAESEDGDGTMTTITKHEAATGGGDPAPRQAPMDGRISPPPAPEPAVQSIALSSHDKKDYARLRKLIRTGLTVVGARDFEVGEAIQQVIERKLYRGTYKTFAQFCTSEFNIARSHAYDLANAAKIYRELSAMEDKPPLPTNERQTRPLNALKDPAARAEAWRLAVALALGKPVSEANVRKAVKTIKRRMKPDSDTEDAEPEINAWKGRIITALKESGYESVFEQPFKWPSDPADMYSIANKRFVKVIGKLTLDEAACAMALKEIAPESLIIINAEDNAPDGILLSEAGDIAECFPPSFQRVAKMLGAYVWDEETVYSAGELDAASDLTWTPIANPDFATLGMDEDETEKAERKLREGKV